MYDEYDGRPQFLSWTSNQTTERWYLPKSREIHQGFTQRFKFNEGKRVPYQGMIDKVRETTLLDSNEHIYQA